MYIQSYQVKNNSETQGPPQTGNSVAKQRVSLPGKADTNSISLRASSDLQYVSKLCWQNFGKI